MLVVRLFLLAVGLFCFGVCSVLGALSFCCLLVCEFGLFIACDCARFCGLFVFHFGFDVCGFYLVVSGFVISVFMVYWFDVFVVFGVNFVSFYGVENVVLRVFVGFVCLWLVVWLIVVL